jgi:hypothetical protein
MRKVPEPKRREAWRVRRADAEAAGARAAWSVRSMTLLLMRSPRRAVRGAGAVILRRPSSMRVTPLWRTAVVLMMRVPGPDLMRD